MRLYRTATTDYARHVIDEGFVGVRRSMYEPEALAAAIAETPEGQVTDRGELPEPIDVEEWVEFRDLPSQGATFSRTTEVLAVEEADGRVHIAIGGGPVLVDDVGDFVLTIEVPDDVALEHEVHEDPPAGWPFREFWMPPDLANRYWNTLKVLDSETGEEVRPDLVGK